MCEHLQKLGPKGHPLQYPGLYSPWGRKESDMAERLSLLFLEDVCSWVGKFYVRWTWLRDAQVVNKMLFLGVPVRVFPEQMSTGIRA